MRTLPPIRQFVSSIDTVLERFQLDRSEATHQVCEHIYLDSAHPQLPLDGFLRLRTEVQPDAPLFDDSQDWRLERLLHASTGVETLAEGVEPVQALSIAAAQGHPGVSPRFGLRFTRERFVKDALVIDIDHNVFYYAIREQLFQVSRETIPRITIRALVPGHEQRARDLLADLPALPYSTKCMMGYSAIEQAFRIPKYNELPGYEYEAKLDAHHLDIDPGGLPFPVVEVVQSDSIRMYFKGHRVNTRGGTARTIIKGSVEELPGKVLKRTEAKVPDVDPWGVGAPKMAMRRYKRKLNVLNPASMRVYTISLHLCESSVTPKEAQGSLMQVEIEYEGTMPPHLSRHMFHFESTGDLSLLFAEAEASLQAGRPEIAVQLLGRIPALTDEPELHQQASELLAQVPAARPAPRDPAAEAEIVEDIAFLRAHLEARYAFRNTRLTKRKWLRKTLRDAVC